MNHCHYHPIEVVVHQARSSVSWTVEWGKDQDCPFIDVIFYFIFWKVRLNVNCLYSNTDTHSEDHAVCTSSRHGQTQNKEKGKTVRIVRPWVDIVYKTGRLSKNQYKEVLRSVVQTIMSTPPLENWDGCKIAALVDKRHQQLVESSTSSS